MLLVGASMNTQQLQLTIQQAQEGDAHAMSALYDAYYDRIAGYALRRVLDQHVAEDITANVFVKLLEHLPRFTWSHEHSFNGWIYRIASNEVSQYFRKQARYEFIPPSNMDAVYAAVGEHRHSAADLEDELDLHQDFLRLYAGIRKLRSRHQEVIHLFYFENLSHREIAGALGMREGSVRVTLHRAINKLQKHITSDTALSSVGVA